MNRCEKEYVCVLLRYERQLEGPNEAIRKTPKEPLTRSKTTPYNKNSCFFCEEPESEKQPLHMVSTFSAGQSLNEAIGLSGNDILRVKVSAAVDANDAHAIDIKYHKNCWARDVTNVLRTKGSKTSEESRLDFISEAAAKIEFLAITESALREGQILTMCDLQNTMQNALASNEASRSTYSRKALKALLSEIPDIEFHKPKRGNEPERVSIKKTRDKAIQLVESIKAQCNKDIKVLFDAATCLRKAINKGKRWEFTGTLEDGAEDVVPEELYLFSRWLIQGSEPSTLNKKKMEDVKKRAMSLSQTTITLCLTERQRNNKKSETLRLSREMPQQLAVGLAVHQATRSKDLVNMLHGFGMAVEYNRLMRVEAQIEATVLHQIEKNGGVYIPPDIVMGRHIYFAVDNVDFSEDTYDGKRTLHGTAMAIYQKKEAEDEVRELR